MHDPCFSGYSKIVPIAPLTQPANTIQKTTERIHKMSNSMTLAEGAITIAVNDETVNIKEWIRHHKSATTFTSKKGTITRRNMKEGTLGEPVPCIVSVIRNCESDSYRIWILYEDTTNESFNIPISNVSGRGRIGYNRY